MWINKAWVKPYKRRDGTYVRGYTKNVDRKTRQRKFELNEIDVGTPSWFVPNVNVKFVRK
ncbi:hypothetical protein Mia14_0854 [Candidatus Mancarchaeum acidiphilum]|uniref:Uncharacterized protein n=1 Tax=Candidatus Mancarchaeum acidiphilum TaxID=1920749 RepID=A0A218NNU0_9ARCH|nr:hypothetical protein Mia14_0854 [Candidatus Mancarchaeum acidiphilum]